MNSEVNGGCKHYHILNDIYISFNIVALTEPNRSLKMSAVYCKLKQVRRQSESVVLENGIALRRDYSGFKGLDVAFSFENEFFPILIKEATET